MVFVCLKVQPKHLIEITGGKKAGCDWGLFTTIFLCAGLFIYAQTGTVSGNINDNSKIALPNPPEITPSSIVIIFS